MRRIEYNREYPQSKKIKEFLFQFFRDINEDRIITQSMAMFIICLSFLQKIYLIDFVFVGNNLDNDSENYKNFSLLEVYDPIRILIRLSILIPILEYDSGIFRKIYPIILFTIYIASLTCFISIAYIINCIILQKKVNLTTSLNIISTIFLFFQWFLYFPIGLSLLYPIYGKIKNISPYNSLTIKIINIILFCIWQIIKVIISVLNNDAVNKSENFLCREDSNREIYDCFLSLLYLLAYTKNMSQGLINFICIFSLFIIIFVHKQIFKKKIYYNQFISEIYGSCLFCLFKIYIDGAISLFWKYYIHDYSLILLGFFIFFKILFCIIYNKMGDIFLKKKIGELKNIDEVNLFILILDEEISKSVVGSKISSERISEYIQEHNTNCTQKNCPLKCKEELFLPLYNKSIKNDPKDLNKNWDKNEVTLIHLIIEIFTELSNKFHGVSKFHFCYSSFLLFRFGNIKLSLLEIENGKNFSSSLQEQFSFFILKNVANQRLINNQYYIAKYIKNNITIIDILDVIVFENLSKELQIQIFECARMKNELWKMLLLNKITLEKLYKKGKEYINKKENIEKIWKQLSKITNQNKTILNIYSEYVHIICDNKLSNFNKEFKLGSNDIDNEDEIEDLVETRFYDDICIFIINLSFGRDIGKINYYNNTVNKLFNFKPNEILGNNISIIIPNSIGRTHDNIIKNFLETGKTRVTGNNTSTFIKLKNNLIRPINLLVMPIPNFTEKSEALGLLRTVSLSSFFVIFDKFGIIDSFTENFAFFDESFYLGNFKENFGDDVDFFIFYIFPFLLQPIEHLGFKPLFLNENSLLELGQFQINAYFDKNLFYILAVIMDNINNDKVDNIQKAKKLRKSQTKIKIEYDKLNDEGKKKYLIYKNLCESLIKMKEVLKTGRDLSDDDNNKINKFDRKNAVGLRRSIFNAVNNNEPINQSKKYFNDIVPYIHQYNEYKNYLEENSDIYSNSKKNRINIDNKNENCLIIPILKKTFNCKITAFNFNKINKIYIMELSIPPNDLENEMSDPSLFSNNTYNNFIKDEIQKKKLQDIPESSSVDDSSSVNSITGKLTFNNIYHLIQRIREEKSVINIFRNASYMNIMFYLFLLFVLIYAIVIIIYSNHYITQMNNLFNGTIKILNYIVKFFNLRKYSHIELRRYYNFDNNFTEFPNLEIYSVNESLALNGVELLILSKNISDILFKITNDIYVNQIENLIYQTSNTEHFTSVNEVENRLIKNNIYISDPNCMKDENILNLLLNHLDIDLTDVTFNNLEKETRIDKINYITLHTDYYFISCLLKNLFSIKELFNHLRKEIKKMIIFGDTIIGIVNFICLFIAFLLLRKMYNINKQIIEKLTTINRNDINEIIKQLEDYINLMKTDNFTIEEFLKNEEEKNIKNLEEFEELIDSKNNSKDSINIELQDETKENSQLLKKETIKKKKGDTISFKSTKSPHENSILSNNNNNEINNENNNNQNIFKDKIYRKTNIFLVFSMNIFAIIIITILYLIISYKVILLYNKKYELYYNLMSKILFSRITNLIALNHLRDIFMFNNTIVFNSTMTNNQFTSYIYYIMITRNLDIFTFFAQNENKFNYITSNKFKSIFYGSLCNLDNINCEYSKYTNQNFSEILIHGFQYSLSYFEKQFDLAIETTNETIGEENYILFVENNEIFVVATILNDYYFNQIYDYMGDILYKEFKTNSDRIFLFLILFSCSCILLLLLIICTKWKQYYYLLKQEEFISIKLIAEIPINVIMKNNDILVFLRSYSRIED